MLWFTIWTVLVLGTLAGGFLLGRRLWRALVALGHELARAGEVADQLAERTAELEERAAASHEAVRPALGTDAQVLRDRVEQLRAVRREQRGRRRERHRATVSEATTRWFG